MSQDPAMHVTSLPKLLSLVLLACALRGGPARAEAPDYALGFSSVILRPQSGLQQKLDGLALGARVQLTSPWSLEALLAVENGTEGGSVSLRQTGLAVGPRYTRVLRGPWQGYAHILVGPSHLQASSPNGSDSTTSLRCAPGVGVERVLRGRWSLRGELDYNITSYAGLTQRSPGIVLGAVYRGR
jgi:hypothetical protein